MAVEFLASTFAGNFEIYNTLLSNNNIMGTDLPASTISAYGIESEFYRGQKINEYFANW